MSLSTKVATSTRASRLLSHYLNTSVPENKQHQINYFRENNEKDHHYFYLEVGGGKNKTKENKRNQKVIMSLIRAKFPSERNLISILQLGQERLVEQEQSDWYIVQWAQLSQNCIMAASKNKWNYIYQWNDKAIKCKRKNKKSEIKEVFSYPRITHLISVWLECGQIMYTNLYLAAQICLESFDICFTPSE